MGRKIFNSGKRCGFDLIQINQERQYIFPYHYVPEAVEKEASKTLHWPWGLHYLAGHEKVLGFINELNPSSLLDLGCGDGRLLREIQHRFPHIELKGVDYSMQAIKMARILNPKIEFINCDITKEINFSQTFDVVTLVEVLEHIPPENVSIFLLAIKKILKPEGFLIITVPHNNQKLNPKHYQHFSGPSLKHIVGKNFNVERVIHFDKSSIMSKMFSRMLGGSERNFIITNRKLNYLLYKSILNGCMKDFNEKSCQRLALVAKNSGQF